MCDRGVKIRVFGFLKISLISNLEKTKLQDQIFILKPIFHQKLGSRWLPNANEIYTKDMKCTWPTPEFCVGYPLHLYSTDWRRGLALGLTQNLGLASGNANFHILDTVGISNAKVWRRGHCPTPAPDARYFAFWWNIGFSVRNICVTTFATQLNYIG